ncbi:MAG: phosphatidylglycerophosphatase A [Candidatus Magnetoovum sp. WYHC-5]|nr:phosphatidylglycerophosphatase A [Candidatus Magnetoovum sp. WYHC-5]
MLKIQPYKTFIRLLFKYIASLGFIGFLPIAPGTWGTLAGFVFLWLVQVDGFYLLILSLIVLVIGVFAAQIAEEEFNKKDSGHIIIDELCGYFVSVVFIEQSMSVLIAGFFLFRFFDIVKPQPVRLCEKLPGGFGVMLDDVMAGIYANIVIQIVILTGLWK